ncbi:MAG: hypothetical protein ACLP52_01960 [Streptosporangiaceae bacterium]
MTGTPEEVFVHHAQAPGAGSLDEIAAATKADDGIDTFVFRDGQIRVQTVRYTLQHKT